MGADAGDEVAMYNASLINDPFADPGVYIECKYRREAVLSISAICISCRPENS